MNCKSVRERLLFYLDSELAAKEKQAVELHLAACPACQKELEALSATQGMLRQAAEAVSTKAAPHWVWFELRQRLALLGKTRPAVSHGVLSRLKASVSGQPIWKPLLAGAISLAVIVSAVISIPRVMGPSPEVLASDIASDAPEIRALAGGEPQVDAAKASGGIGYVLTHSTAGDSNLAYVDLTKGTVIRVFMLTVPPLTEEDKVTSVNIARSDPNIQRILYSGGTISTGEMFPLPPQLRLEIINGQPVVWSEGVLVGAVLRMNSLVWVARIDLGEGKVIDVSMVSPPQYPTQQPAMAYSEEELVEIAKSDNRVEALLDRGAEVTHVGIGRGKMAGTAAVILRLGEEVWSVRIDLDSRTVTSVGLIPKAKHGKANVFNPE